MTSAKVRLPLLQDERILLVTELMESGDLWHALMQYKESGVLSWHRRGKRIAVEIARGLHFLHRHNIVHFVRPSWLWRQLVLLDYLLTSIQVLQCHGGCTNSQDIKATGVEHLTAAV